MTSSRSPVRKCEAYLNAVFFNMFSGMGWGHDPRKWRKIGIYCEDLWGIPACRAEIGNWTVVIIGCGIDVVPINQNCWINKNCSRFLCHGGVQKMFELLAPPSLIMVQYLQQWFGEVLPGFCLSTALSFTRSNYLSFLPSIHLLFLPSIHLLLVLSVCCSFCPSSIFVFEMVYLYSPKTVPIAKHLNVMLTSCLF